MIRDIPDDCAITQSVLAEGEATERVSTQDPGQGIDYQSGSKHPRSKAAASFWLSHLFEACAQIRGPHMSTKLTVFENYAHSAAPLDAPNFQRPSVCHGWMWSLCG